MQYNAFKDGIELSRLGMGCMRFPMLEEEGHPIDEVKAQEIIDYAMANGIKLVEFLPDYALFGKRAPIIRDKQIAEYADMGFAFWDGSSKGTVHTVNFFKELRKPVRIFVKTK